MVLLSRPWYTGLVLALMVWGTSFFLHFFWEMLQVPFFVGMAEASHADVIWLCTRATVGDANIALFVYGVAALVSRDGYWLQGPWPGRTLGTYLAVGLVVTVLFEAWATGAGERWSYNAQMPRLPLLGTGATPLLQWLLIPVLSLYVLRWMFLGWHARLR
ncbi:hypothetical protein QQM79_02975 [Marinobacteraceae bacterium S3BR75-40.1]